MRTFTTPLFLLFCSTILFFCFWESYRHTAPPLVEALLITSWALIFGMAAATQIQRPANQSRALALSSSQLLICVAITSALFTLRWGRYTFISTFHHDEFGYFAAVSGQSIPFIIKNIFEPLNEHFMPVYRALFAVLIELFGGRHYAFATVGFGLTLLILTLLGHVALICSQSWRLTSVFLILISGQFIIWETLDWQAGIVPVALPLAAFLYALVQSVTFLTSAPGYSSSIRPYVSTTLGLCVATFSSSLITLPVVYLSATVVMAATHRKEPHFWRKLFFLITTALSISLVYFSLRRIFVTTPPPSPNLHALFESFPAFIGHCLVVHAIPLPSLCQHWILGIASIALSVAISGIWLVRVYKLPVPVGAVSNIRLLFFIIGLIIFFLGLLQVFVGRGNFVPLQSRHALFPLLGLYLAAFMLVCELLTLAPLFSPRVRLALSSTLTAIAVATSLAGSFTELNSPAYEQRIASIVARSEFLTDLNHLICAERSATPIGITVSLPDLAPPSSMRMQFPFNAPERGFGLGFLSRMYQLPCYDAHLVKFIPTVTPEAYSELYSRFCQHRDSEKCKFLRRHYHKTYRSLLAQSKAKDEGRED